MLVKGHDFPNLNLVAVVDIDSALFSHDFRSTEKISQQLVQVSGRSGRKSDNSEVVIQTRVPNHPLITELLKKGYSIIKNKKGKIIKSKIEFGKVSVFSAEFHDGEIPVKKG